MKKIKPEYAHYWIIDENNFGICVKCGATRQFPVPMPPPLTKFERRFIESWHSGLPEETCSVQLGVRDCFSLFHR